MQSNKLPLNVVFVGQFQSGKSTAMAHFLLKVGVFTSEEAEKAENIARDNSSPDMRLAQLLANTKHETQRRLTVRLTFKKFENEFHSYTLIDTPGHKDYRRTTIRAIFQSDVAVLVVNARPGEFERGIDKLGQTKELATICYAAGLKQIIVCVNQMDDKEVGWSEERYNQIKLEIYAFLKKVGYNPEKIEVPVIPISGLTGDNLLQKPDFLAWYDGPTLIKALNDLIVPGRHTEKPLRIPIDEIDKIGGVGTVVSGRIESGILKPGTTVRIDPKGLTSEVKSIHYFNDKLEEAQAGTQVGINLRNVLVAELEKGNVICPIDNPLKMVKEFTAQIILIAHQGVLKQGSAPVFYFHTGSATCRFEQLIEKIDKATGKAIEKNPPNLRTGDSALVKLVPSKPICLEPFSVNPAMGRLIIRDNGITVGVGVVKSVITADFKEQKKISYW